MNRVTHEDLMRYLDGELSPSERSRIESAVKESTEVARELSIFTAMREDLIDLSFAPVGHHGSAWDRVNRRLSRPVGWGLILAGVSVWLVFGVYTFLTSPADLWEKLATGAVVIGLLILLSTVILERYTEWLTDPYKDVHR